MQEWSRCVWVLARIADRVAGEQVEQARCVAGLGADEQQAVGRDRFVIATVRKELAVGGGKFFGELQRAADELIEMPWFTRVERSGVGWRGCDMGRRGLGFHRE